MSVIACQSGPHSNTLVTYLEFVDRYQYSLPHFSDYPS
jgi:hypothetical protein